MKKDKNKLMESKRVRIKDIARLANVSTGTVDRVIHNREGVSEKSKQKVREIIKILGYQPNMYASALASNKKYNFICLLPLHKKGEYWTDIETGIQNAIDFYADFNVSAKIIYYNPYQYDSFITQYKSILQKKPDGVVFTPTTPTHSMAFAQELERENIPYVYLDFNIEKTKPLAFYGQDSSQSGFFAAKMLMLLAQDHKEVVIFRHINKGIVGSNQQENREVGFRKYIKEHHPDCVIHELNLFMDEELKNIKLLNHFFKKNPQILTGIVFNSKAYLIGEYLERTNKSNFRFIGYDLLERSVNCLKKGTVDFLIAQQPKYQGYNSIEALCNSLILKKEVNPINYMPIDLLARETIIYYNH
ncbi:MAG: substrate-binding domain-containing protein [Bacteroidales bacterium]|nr:substrate-binding domain-containing protein [Bacteroidales bacterium]